MKGKPGMLRRPSPDRIVLLESDLHRVVKADLHLNTAYDTHWLCGLEQVISESVSSFCILGIKIITTS